MATSTATPATVALATLLPGAPTDPETDVFFLADFELDFGLE
jgi:hypothetical protein